MPDTAAPAAAAVSLNLADPLSLVREILAHLADCELVFSFRVRQMLAADNAYLQPFDQTAWSSRYTVYDVPSALALFTAARSWNLKLFSTLKPEDYKRTATHPERGTLTLQIQLETNAGHDINHLLQLESLLPS